MTQTTNLGVAGPGVSVRTYHVLDDTLHFVAPNLRPPVLGAFDLRDRTVTRHSEFPTGSGAWAMAALGDDVYVGTSGETDLYRYGTTTGDLERVARIPDERVVCDAHAHGDRVFLGTYPSAHLYEYDAASGELRDHGRQTDQRYVRNVRATDDTVYVGTAAQAHLFAVDRATGDREDVLPGDVAGESSTRTMWLTDSHVVLLTRPSGRFVLVDRSTHDARVRMPADAASVSNLLVDDGEVYLAAALAGDEDGDGRMLYRYDVAADTFERVGRLPAPALDQGLFRWNGAVVGCESGGAVWTYDAETGTATTTDLEDAGLPSGALIPRALGVYDGAAVAATPGTLHVHERDRGSPRRIPTPRSTKALTTAGDTLYAAKYVDAVVAACDGVEARDLFRIGHDQNRPRALHYHPGTNLVFVGTVPEYGHLGGALSYFEHGSETVTVERNVVPDQSVCSLASTSDTVFVGSEIHGEKVDPVAEEAAIAAWDPVREERRWSTPVDGAEAATDLLALDGTVWGTASDGSLFAFDPTARDVTFRERIAGADAFSPRPTQLVSLDGSLYCAAADRLVRVDPATRERTTVLEGRDPAVPELAVDADAGVLYTLDGRDLLRVSVEQG